MINIDNLFNNRNELLRILDQESPIGCILVSASFLEKCLVLLLNNRFIKGSKTVEELLKYNGLLGEFSGKIKLCYALGLIDKEKYNDLITIAEIRNIIAHTHTLLDFESQQIVERCNSLNAYRVSITQGYLDLFNDNPPKISRLQFTESVINIINDLMANSYLNKILRTDQSG